MNDDGPNSPYDSRRDATGRQRRWTSPGKRKGLRSRAVQTVLGLALLAGVVLGVWLLVPDVAETHSPEFAAPANAAVERTAALAPLSLPADEGPHAAAMEWWYYSGILDGSAGGRYAFHMAVFVAQGLVKHTVMHVALADLRTGKRYVSQTRTGGVPARTLADGFDFRQDGWQATSNGASHALKASFEGFDVALDMKDVRPAVLHRTADSKTPGLLDFGAGGVSYYYSRPRIAAQGEIVLGGSRETVHGDVWFDHQWGDFDPTVLGWNWFSLHLADGSDVMLYQLFDAQGQPLVTAGTVATAKGAVPLQAKDITLTPGKSWTSPRTQIRYVVEWRLQLPTGAMNIRPLLVDAEFDARPTSANIYWEGPVEASGGADGNRGQGFLEMSGYDRLAAARASGK